MKDKKKIQVVAAVIRKEEKILVAKRSESKNSGGLWEFPGGKVESGEEPKQALIREIIEELDCVIRPETFLGRSEVSIGSKTIEMSLFAARIDRGQPKTIEHEEIRWITKDQLYDFSWAPADIPLLATVYGSCF